MSAKKPVIIPFTDDSTLFFGLRMRECLRAADPDRPVEFAWYSAENALSERQMAENLPEGPDMLLTRDDFRILLQSDYAHALITSRVFGPLRGALWNPVIKAHHPRPPVVAFLGGIDFFPRDGYLRRRDADIVYVLPKKGVAQYDKVVGDGAPLWRDVRFGHPTFLAPKGPPADLASRRDVYFFAQALSPSTAEGRMHMLRALAAMARANPDRTFWIKLRHLPEENATHLHRERHDYPGLLKQMAQVPDNLRLTACTMDAALADCAIGITCTSTAAIDVIREGVPCMVNLDYVDAPLDPLNAPMARLFEGSDLITSLEDMLHLRARPPHPDWVAENFCGTDLGADVLAAIDGFAARRFKVGRHDALEALREAAPPPPPPPARQYPEG